jgi:flagellar hook-associated protein 1 FlgK
MSSLFGSLSLAANAMLVQQSAIGVTANNVANTNTPGYSRQRAELAESNPVFNGTRLLGTGVTLQQITSLRDRVLELRIQDEMQQQGSLEAQVNALSDVDLQFSTQNANIGDALNNFFNSLSNLSPNASNSALRESVLVSAKNLATQFRSTSSMLTQRQFNLNLEIQQAVAQVNRITAQVADLNQRISTSGLPEDQLGTYVDQRNVLLQNLSSLLGNHVITADDGLTLTASDGTALVVGNRSYNIDVAADASGRPTLSISGHNITSSTSGGSISGLLQVRNTVIPGILSSLDSLASNLITSFNQAHEQGIDLNGNTGVDFFVPAPANGVGAAAAFAVNITSSDQIAASTDGSAGGNDNLNTLIALRSQKIINGDTPADAYAKLTFQVGSQLANAKSDQQSCDAMVQQLNNQRGAISGVSLDEEASNLIRFQRAYEAAARVLTILSDLTGVSVNLGNPGATV